MDSFIRGGKKGPKQDREGRRSLTGAGVVHLSDKKESEIIETTKAGQWTLSLGERRRDLSRAGVVHLSDKKESKIVEITKAGQWTLSLGDGRRGLTKAGVVHLSGKNESEIVRSYLFFQAYSNLSMSRLF